MTLDSMIGCPRLTSAPRPGIELQVLGRVLLASAQVDVVLVTRCPSRAAQRTFCAHVDMLLW
jgi:hypothetical protein